MSTSAAKSFHTAISNALIFSRKRAMEISKSTGDNRWVFESSVFGDTIILIWSTHKAKIPRYIAPAAIITKILLVYLLQQNIRLRGAISFGSFVKRGDSVLGPAIADTAEWHEQIDMIGCVATPTLGLYLDEVYTRHPQRMTGVSLDGEDPDASCFIRYLTPTKSGQQDLYHIPWPQAYFLGIIENLQHDEIASSFRHNRAEFLKDLRTGTSIPPGVEKKYRNTVDFYDFCQKRYPDIEEPDYSAVDPLPQQL